MSYILTPSKSSRITKKTKKPVAFQRSVVSPFRPTAKRKSGQNSKSESEQHTGSRGEDDDLAFPDERLEDLGLCTTINFSKLPITDVMTAVRHVHSNMFDGIPERAGMNSTRIATVLQFQKALPPAVSNAHVHAFINSPTLVEKEISQLVEDGTARRITIPGRGVGASSVSDALVLVEDWVNLVQEARDLEQMTKERYITLLKQDTRSISLRPSVLKTEDEIALKRAGFLTSGGAETAKASNRFAPKIGSNKIFTIDKVSKAASGSISAVGGQNLLHESGGGGIGGLRNDGSESKISKPTTPKYGSLRFSLPSMGSFLRLIVGARAYLMELLSKSKYNEAPMYLLRERWNGATTANKRTGRSKDPFAVILPGKTRKWKDFYGLKFECVLAECLGAGMIEMFETRSVGLGVRAL